MNNISLKIKNYKCFGDEPQGFEEILPVNIIIGRNNSGKSSLLDLLSYAVAPHDISPLSHKGRKPQVSMKAPLSEQEIKRVFHPGTSGGTIGGDHWQFGQGWVDKEITIELDLQGKTSFIKIDPPFPEKAAEYQNKLGGVKENRFSTKTFKRLRSERDLRPEEDRQASVYEHGDGATNLIQRFINKATLPSDLIEIVFLKELNKIVNPDLIFTDIVVQQLEDNKWEVYLEEEQKGRIALSQSGSGLKTILLVLVFIQLVPYSENKTLDHYIFGFEEIENNLHPASQRRLFLYLRDIAIDKKTNFFITTHSNVVIDLFSNDPFAQIIHITHNGIEAKANQVKVYLDKQGILDDLDVRASDLLQSNGVVWVEGPSDRLYFNRWIELWTDGKLREGAHYQCVFYGGRLLAHLTADISEQEQEQLVRILLVNRNAIMLIDSDKKYKSQEIRATKKRIRDEFAKIEALCWITKGREMENYLPLSALSSYLGVKLKKPLDQYGAFSEYLEKI